MRTQEVTLEQFFKGNVKYVSPSFQRPYSWISGVCERILESLNQKHTDAHFQGALVTMDLKKTDQQTVHKSLLIDGNHRLLTLLIILIAIRDEFHEKYPDISDTINSNFFFTYDSENRPHFKSIVPPKDRATFENLLTHKGSPTPSSPLLRVHRFVRSALAPLPYEQQVRMLECITNQLTFVSITLDRDENPYPIFKLLNTPGEDFTHRGLREYTRFSPDPELMGLIAGGESQDVEFKERAITEEKHEISTVASIARSVAGFMNSFTGGVLLIGIRDDGSIRGVDGDYKHIDRSKNSWDGFNLFLNNSLRMRLSAENPFLYYTIKRHQIQGHDVCSIHVKPTPVPVYIDKHLFVRNGCQTIDMIGPDLVNYVHTRWS